MPGLLRGVARTAVAAGTWTAVSNRVSRRQANRWAEQEAQPYQQQPYQQQPYQQQPYQQQPYQQQPYQQAQPVAPPPQPAPAPDPIAQLKALADLKAQGVLTEAEFASQKARILGT